MSEEKITFLRDLEAPYRLPSAIQIILFSMVIIAIIIFEYYLYQIYQIPLELLVIGFLGITSFLYPIFIHIRHRLVVAIGLSLLGATIFGGLYLSLKYLTINLSNIREFALFVVVVEIITIEFIQHVVSSLKVYKTTKIIIIDIILSIIFGICLFIFLYGLPPQIPGLLNLFWSAVLTVILTILFAYAILPEKPY